MGAPLRLAGVIRESVVDGPGWRFVVFAQGCPHRCQGCQNPQTHDPAGGYDSDTDRILAAVKQDPMLAGVTLSGGEPFSQAESFAVLAQGVHELGLTVVTFTGWTFEALAAGFGKHPGWQALLNETDILIDGKFVEAQRSLDLKFRGSRNQRMLDVAASLKAGRAVEME